MTKIYKGGLLIGETMSISNSEQDNSLEHVPSISMVSKKINWPIDSSNLISYGTKGQILSSLENGKTQWIDLVYPSEEIITQTLEQWLTEHPESITVIQNNEITTDKIINSAITTNKIADNAIETAKISNSAVTTNKIANNAITNIKINTNAINTNNIIDHAITSTKIADSNITTRKIMDNAITTNKIANLTVTSDKIANEAITTQKIIDNSITNNKLVQSGGILSDVEKILKILEEDFQIFPKITPRIISGQYIDALNNEIVYNENMSMTEPIPILQNQIIHFLARGQGTINAMIATCDIDNTNRLTVVSSIDSAEHDYSYTALNDGYVVLSFCNYYGYEIRKTWNYASLMNNS